MSARALTLLFFCLLAPAVALAEAAPPPLLLANVYEGNADVSQYWVSEKLDGVRGYWDGERLLTRGGYPVNPPDWFTAGWPERPMDGELWMGRGRFAAVSGVVRTDEPVDAEWREVRFMVFDLPAHGGPFEARVFAMRRMLDDPDIPWLRPVRQFRVDDAAALDERLADIVDKGGEGLMLHRRDAIHETGRSDALLKYKPYRDAEARVVAYTEGEGKYEGMLGALVVERPDGLRFRIGTGFSDAERADPPPVGSRITYRYNGLTADGVPRFARFLRVRPRMPAEQSE
ncbi:DNA ligase [wastewater metagenome]|uniref:DNA ligase n=2 Tax=unclassified sequences TaxID=12908 RepID=A0A5B8RHG9_9ZZZZ|nr:DNA ligase [uncultured organism]